MKDSLTLLTMYNEKKFIPYLGQPNENENKQSEASDAASESETTRHPLEKEIAKNQEKSQEQRDERKKERSKRIRELTGEQFDTEREALESEAQTLAISWKRCHELMMSETEFKERSLSLLSEGKTKEAKEMLRTSSKQWQALFGHLDAREGDKSIANYKDEYHKAGDFAEKVQKFAEKYKLDLGFFKPRFAFENRITNASDPEMPGYKVIRLLEDPTLLLRELDRAKMAALGAAALGFEDEK